VFVALAFVAWRTGWFYIHETGGGIELGSQILAFAFLVGPPLLAGVLIGHWWAVSLALAPLFLALPLEIAYREDAFQPAPSDLSPLGDAMLLLGVDALAMLLGVAARRAWRPR
jgi:hypothetical protein